MNEGWGGSGGANAGFGANIGRKSAHWVASAMCKLTAIYPWNFQGLQNGHGGRPMGLPDQMARPGVQPRAPPSSLCSSDEEDRLEPAEYYGAGNGASGS